MSYDLYLLPLQHEDGFETAMELLNALDRKDPSHVYELDARTYAKIILDMDSRYQRFKRDFAEIARLLGVTEAEAQAQFAGVELNGKTEDGQPLAQFCFDRFHITIHCYSGTTADELDNYVVALCAATRLAAVDPQEGRVWRVMEGGSFG